MNSSRLNAIARAPKTMGGLLEYSDFEYIPHMWLLFLLGDGGVDLSDWGRSSVPLINGEERWAA